jgi:hypothetical protein
LNPPQPERPRREQDITAAADEVIRAVVNKLEANRRELAKARYGNIKFRKDKGKIEVEFTPTI